ncbi:MAG: hypothetical protein N2249_02160 [Melioribacter sp.]|nr:hypothetical protein [Melioribacter sp.]
MFLTIVKKLLFVVVILYLCISKKNFAQYERDTSDFSISNYLFKSWNNNIDKQLNTYSFNTQLKYFLSGTNYFIGLNENLNSTVISTLQKNIKDQHYLRIFSNYNFLKNLSGGVYIVNNLYSDNRQVAINRTAVLNSSIFVKYLPVQNIELTSFGGFSSNSQIGEKDNGYVYGAEALMKNILIWDFDINSIIKLRNEDISPRRNLLRNIGIELNNRFKEEINNIIFANIFVQRKDFYFVADDITAKEFNIVNNIQSREEKNYTLQDNLKITPENSPLTLNILGRIFLRDIERNTKYVSIKNISSSSFDSKIRELKLDFSSSAEYKLNNFSALLKFSFTEREEKHQPRKIEGINEIILKDRERTEALKNNVSQVANISLSTFIKLSDKDILIIDFSHRKLKYDTPSPENYDDRDELLSIGRIILERKFNSFFKAFVNIDGSLNKIVYIFSERSSNNNVQRILKLSSGGLITFKKFTSYNTAEVSANYTVFDYERLNPNYKSFSFRQFIFRDSTSIMLTKRIFFLFMGYTKVSEQGDFQWSSFSSKPLRYLSEQYCEPKLFINYLKFIIGTGLRYFSLSTYNFDEGMRKRRISNYTSIGPVVDINYNIENNLALKIYGFYEFINSESNTKRKNANFNLKFLYNF